VHSDGVVESLVKFHSPSACPIVSVIGGWEKQPANRGKPRAWIRHFRGPPAVRRTLC